LGHTFEDIVSIENILNAWREFVKGKRGKKDVQEFQSRLMANILELNQDLVNHTYRHGGYHAFNICDPKPRRIHKASVRDRLLHHAIYRILYPFFEKTFIADSFSCRLDKGTHKALNRFRSFFYIVSRNNMRSAFILQCDIKKFFANIDHKVLTQILATYISDQNIIWLLSEVIDGFSTKPGIGVPLGNLTSQLFVNIYMNEFDQFVKHTLKEKHYIRYADDFVFFSEDRNSLENLIPPIKNFLDANLHLELHPEKLFIKTIASGVDFLGWVHFPDHRVLRTSTKRRMVKRLSLNPSPETIASYQGMLKQGNTYKLRSRNGLL
jgi:retron-type reverse transcriptase